MSEFIALFYAQYFLQAMLSSAAPRVDLEFLKNMKIYEVKSWKNINMFTYQFYSFMYFHHSLYQFKRFI